MAKDGFASYVVISPTANHLPKTRVNLLPLLPHQPDKISGNKERFQNQGQNIPTKQAVTPSGKGNLTAGSTGPGKPACPTPLLLEGGPGPRSPQDPVLLEPEYWPGFLPFICTLESCTPGFSCQLKLAGRDGKAVPGALGPAVPPRGAHTRGPPGRGGDPQEGRGREGARGSWGPRLLTRHKSASNPQLTSDPTLSSAPAKSDSSAAGPFLDPNRRAWTPARVTSLCRQKTASARGGPATPGRPQRPEPATRPAPPDPSRGRGPTAATGSRRRRVPLRGPGPAPPASVRCAPRSPGRRRPTYPGRGGRRRLPARRGSGGRAARGPAP